MDSRIFHNFCTIFIPMATVFMLNPTYALYIETTLDIKPEMLGYMICISLAPYVCFCPIVSVVI